jgi:outer membrane protein assembly factor BamB
LSGVPDAKVVDVARAREGWIARVDGPVTLARAFAALPGCLWVERFRDVQLFNNTARTSASVPTGRGAQDGPIMDVEDVWARGIHGEGQIAAAADTGLSTGAAGPIHADFGDGSAGNPARVTGYAVNNRSSWDDDFSIGGGHGTHTAGSIVGNGIRSGSTPSTNTFPGSSYAGIAPKASFVFQSIMQSGGTPGVPALGVPADLYDLFVGPYAAGARVHSNSWGTSGAGDYDDLAQAVDAFVWDHPDMVVTFSAGNSGADGYWECFPTGEAIDGVIDSYSIGSPGTAKNCITVGASESYRPDFVYQTSEGGDCNPAGSYDQRTWGWGWSPCDYTQDPIHSDKMSDNASGLAAFSSRGPTFDSRTKPDLVAPGAVVISTRTDKNQDFEDWGECEIPSGYQPYYLNMAGTSMSNPLTAGAATLVRQYYADGWHANGSDVTSSSAVPADAFDPSAALVKATLVNGAWDMAPGQYGSDSPQPEIPPAWDRVVARDLPNNAEGYGRVDLEGSLFPAAGWGRSAFRRLHVRDVAAGIVQDARDTYSYQVGSSSDSLVATLVWTDPPGAVYAGVALVNDLDLEVTSPSGTRYSVNNVDDDEIPFAPDTLNNVEQVKVSAPETGQWTVEVVGQYVPGNAAPGTDAQPYALVFSAVTCAVPVEPQNVTAVAVGNNRIDVAWESTGTAEYHLYRGTSPGGAKSLVATVAGTGFTDTTVAAGIEYYYVVKSASAAQCESPVSAEVSAIAMGVCSLPPQFEGVASVAPATSGPCGLVVGWAAASAPCGGPVTYGVYRSTTPGFVPGVANRIQAGLSTTSFTDTSGLASGTTYYYVARATDEGNGVEDANTVERSGTPGSGYLYGPESFDALAEGSDAGWTRRVFTGTGNDWQGVQACAAHSGTNVFRFGGAGCDLPYAEAANNTAEVLPAIAVPAGTTNTRLSFWHRWSFEAGYDGAFLAISLNGVAYTQVPASAILSSSYNGINITLGIQAWDGDHSGEFVQTVVDLDAACTAVAGSGGCAGRTVYVAFVTVNDDLFSYLGWFIDDVQIIANVPNACSLAPSPVQFLTARSTAGTNLLEWENPASGSYGAGIVRYRTDGVFPTSPTDGAGVSCSVDNKGLGAYNQCRHSGLVNGTTYSYSVFVDNGAGVYSSRRTVAAKPFSTFSVHKWAYSTGASSLAPPGVLPGAIGDGAVFALSNDRALHAMNPTNLGGTWPRAGSFAWTPAAMDGPAQHRPPVVPLAAGARVFLASQDGYAYAIDAHTGTLVWTSTKLGEVLQANPAGLFSDLKAGAPNLVFVGTRNATSANVLYALDPSTGGVVTSFDNGGGATAIGIITGIAVDYDSKYVYFTSRSSGVGSPKTLWCLDASARTSLTPVWSLALGDIDGSPVLYEGVVYVGTNAGEVKAVDAATHAELWAYTCSPLDGPVKGYVIPHFGSSPLRLYFATTDRVWAIVDNGGSATLAWSATSVTGPSTPLFVVGTTDLLIGGNDGTLYQLSTVDGGVTGSVNLGTNPLGSPARDTASGLIHVGSTGGVLHAVTLPLP